MLKLSKKMLSAIEAVVDIAYNSGGQPVQNREITRRQGIPHRYLEHVLQNLVREGILTGVRGPRGGYQLARERRRISLGDISRVVQKMEQDANTKNTQQDSDIRRHVVHPLWLQLQEDLSKKLDEISIETLCMRAHQAGVVSEIHKKLDYDI